MTFLDKHFFFLFTYLRNMMDQVEVEVNIHFQPGLYLCLLEGRKTPARYNYPCNQNSINDQERQQEATAQNIKQQSMS
jgi:hypothetical protein